MDNNTAQNLFDQKTKNSIYNQERLKLLPNKGKIKATKDDMKFFDSMTIENGVRAIRQYLAPIEGHKTHDSLTQLPQFYAKNFDELLEFYQEKGGAYYSPNGFKKHSTAKNNILTIKSAFLDIDFDAEFPLWIGEKLQIVEMTLKQASMPFPTAIIDSGYGLHLYYIFEEPKFDNSKDKVIARLLERINTYLVSKFNETIEKITDLNIIADPIATNSNRLLRLPTTWNGKNEVHCIQFDESKLYPTLDDFVEDYLDNYDSEKVERAKKARQNAQKQNKNKISKMINVNTLNVSRINDLETLAKLRYYDLKGQRNEFLHIYACQYVHHALDDWQEEVYKMNSKLVQPLRTNEVKSIIKSAERRQYLYKNKTIIDKLRIDDDELKYMQMDRVTAREKRKVERQRRRDKKRKRDKRIILAYQSGETQTAIARQEGIARKTVYNRLKEHGVI